MPERKPVTVIAGIGPGLGAALAARFAREGHAIALLSRSEQSRAPIVETLRSQHRGVEGFACNAGDPASVQDAFEKVRDSLGAPTVLLYNAGSFAAGGILELSPEVFEAAWRANCYGGFLTAREVLPAMIEAGAGTILFTGATAALRGGAGFAGLAVGKFGLRALAQSTAREFAPQGIHVAHVVIDGQIGGPKNRELQPERTGETFLAPEAIADAYWQLHNQPRSAWTQELDLRPHVEKF